jgi:hypothetical protein
VLSPGDTDVDFISASAAMAHIIGIGRGKLAPPSLMLTMRRVQLPTPWRRSARACAFLIAAMRASSYLVGLVDLEARAVDLVGPVRRRCQHLADPGQVAHLR